MLKHKYICIVDSWTAKPLSVRWWTNLLAGMRAGLIRDLPCFRSEVKGINERDGQACALCFRSGNAWLQQGLEAAIGLKLMRCRISSRKVRRWWTQASRTALRPSFQGQRYEQGTLENCKSFHWRVGKKSYDNKREEWTNSLVRIQGFRVSRKSLLYTSKYGFLKKFNHGSSCCNDGK
jgi:hypothetical protein